MMIEGMFFALTLTAACIAALLTYRMGLKEGAIRERRRRDYEVLRRAMDRVERLANESPDIWETEIDA